MDLDDVLGSLGGGGQVGQIKEVVDLVLNNKDSLLDAVAFVRDHGDDLIDLMQRLPDILERAGSALATAGDAAMQASQFLVAGDGVDADDVASAAATAIEVCTEHLGTVASLLGRVAGQLDDIRVPTLGVDRTEMMGINVVSGLDVGSKAVARGPADSIKNTSDQMQAVVGALADAGAGLAQLQANLGAAGEKIQSVAGEIERSGSALVELSPGEKKQPVARKGTAKKRPTTKKSPARKTTAKKKAPVKKAASSKRSTSKKAPARRATTKKATVKKATVKKAPVKKASVKKSGARRTATKPSPTKGLGSGVLKRR